MRNRAQGIFEPPRPAFTPVLVAALFYWATCAAAMSCLRTATSGFCCEVAAVGAMALAASFVLFACSRGAAWSILLLACVLGLFSGGSRAYDLHSIAENVGDGGAGTIEIVLADDARRSSYGMQVTGVADLRGRSCKVAVSLPEGETGWRYGQRMAFAPDVKAIDFETDEFNWNRGVVLKTRPKGKVEETATGLLGPLVAVRSTCIDALAGDGAEHALLQALVCGYRPGFADTDDYAAFQTCGLAHLVAVSGAHLVIVVGLLLTVLRAFRVPKVACVVATTGAMLAYLVVSGVPVSAVRACVMSAIGLSSFFGKRRSNSANALGLGIFLLVGSAPETALSISFALSTLSTLGIVVFSSLFAWLFSRARYLSAPLVTESLTLTCAASLLSQPFSCSIFSLLPLVAPISNIATALVFPVVCLTGLVAALMSCVGVPGAHIAVWLSVQIARVLDVAVCTLAKVPHAAVPLAIDTLTALVASAAAAIVLWVAWTRVKPRHLALGLAAIAVAFVLVSRMASAGDMIAMLDVGQGDAMLVRSGGATMLVDTGNQDSKLAEALARQHVFRIDVLLVTHSDDDHCGSMDALQRRFEVGRTVLAADMLTCTEASCEDLVDQARDLSDDVEGLAVGDSFGIGAFDVRVVWPHGFTADGGNPDSLSIVMSYDGDADGNVDATVFAMGDAEREEVAAMIDEGNVGKVDILKVGHHGSKNAMDEAQAASLSPSIALIGVGKGNRYGHPAPETLELLEGVGAQTFRTDLDGTVVCRLHAGGVSVSTMQ